MQIFLKNNLQFLRPQWPALEKVRAFVTTRIGGDSQSPYDAFNLAGHVGDNPNQVAANRQALGTALNLPNEPLWLAQEHTVDAIHWQGQTYPRPPVADASWTNQSGQVSSEHRSMYSLRTSEHHRCTLSPAARGRCQLDKSIGAGVV